MEDLINRILEKYFSEFKEYHLIFLIAFTLITVITNIFLSIWTNQRIERFKNGLKKTEIKFSLYNELQIKALSKLYQLLVDFQKKTKLIKESNNLSTEKHKNLVQNWIAIYIQCSNEFSMEKYILPKEIKDSYSAILTDYDNLLNLVNYEKRVTSLYYTNENGETELGGEYKDLDDITTKIKELDRIKIMLNTIQKTSLLREKIEKIFERME